MGRKPLKKPAKEGLIDPEANERLLPPSQQDDPGGQEQCLPQPSFVRKENWKNLLRQASLPLVVSFLLIYTFFMGILIGIHWKNRVIDVVCLERTSRPSPLIPSIKPTWTLTAFNGSLLKENIYRQPAGSEVDAAWEALGVDYRPVIVPEQSAKSMGLEDHVRVNDKYGGGFPANIEGLHHLHCLNLLRQALYFNVNHSRSEGNGAWKNEDWLVSKHITHCLDIVRQQLMCTVDMGAMGQIWMQHPEEKNDARPFVDFNTLHVCRDFEAVRMWAEEHQISPDVPKDFLQPPDEANVLMYSAIP